VSKTVSFFSLVLLKPYILCSLVTFIKCLSLSSMLALNSIHFPSKFYYTLLQNRWSISPMMIPHLQLNRYRSVYFCLFQTITYLFLLLFSTTLFLTCVLRMILKMFTRHYLFFWAFQLSSCNIVDGSDFFFSP